MKRQLPDLCCIQMAESTYIRLREAPKGRLDTPCHTKKNYTTAMRHQLNDLCGCIQMAKQHPPPTEKVI